MKILNQVEGQVKVNFCWLRVLVNYSAYINYYCWIAILYSFIKLFFFSFTFFIVTSSYSFHFRDWHFFFSRMLIVEFYVCDLFHEYYYTFISYDKPDFFWIASINWLNIVLTRVFYMIFKWISRYSWLPFFYRRNGFFFLQPNNDR